MKSADITLNYGNQVLSGFIRQEWIDTGKYLPLMPPPKNLAIKDVAAALARALENPVGDIAPLGEPAQAAEDRLASWVERYGSGKTITVIDDPGYVVNVR